MELQITPLLSLPFYEIHMKGIRAQGAGGQNVNKVASAIHVHVDIRACSLPTEVKERLLKFNDAHITQGGLIVIKCQKYRTFGDNKRHALGLLVRLIRSALYVQKVRRATRVPRRVIRKRLENKAHRAQVKVRRQRPAQDD